MPSSASAAGRGGAARPASRQSSRQSARPDLRAVDGGGSRAAAGAPSSPVRRSALVDLWSRPLTPYYLLLGATVMLLALGLVMVLSASSVTAYEDSGSSFSVFSKQLMWSAMGVPLMLVASRLPVRVFRWAAYPALAGVLALLGLVMVLGVSVNGNQNWLAFGPIRLQPSEFAKLALVLWGADLLARKARSIDRYRHLLVPLAPVAGLILLLVLAGGDLGTSLVLMAITGALLFFAGAPMRLFGSLLSLGLAGVAFMTWSKPSRRRRLLSFLDPSSDPLGTGYQLMHSKYALGSGGWFGLGLGASREKWSWLPEQQTDFILAIIGEELGLVGTLAVLLLFGVIIASALRVAQRTRDPFVRLAAACIAVWIGVQAVVNIGAVTGLLPIAGIPLPLISYGGSALLPTLVALGMLMSFARHERDAVATLAARGPGLAQRTARRAFGWLLPHRDAQQGRAAAARRPAAVRRPAGRDR